MNEETVAESKEIVGQGPLSSVQYQVPESSRLQGICGLLWRVVFVFGGACVLVQNTGSPPQRGLVRGLE